MDPALPDPFVAVDKMQNNDKVKMKLIDIQHLFEK